MSTIVPAQLSSDKFLYVYTANHVGRLNRRNKLSSPPLELPEAPVAVGLGYKEIVDSLRIVLLRGVVRSSTDAEADDPIGVFLQCHFTPKDKFAACASKSVQHLRCRLSISCTPVRPGGHSHSGGPDDIELTPEDNFKGMRSLLPAVALKSAADKKKKKAEGEEEDAEEAEGSHPAPSEAHADDEEAEKRFVESTPVEFHVTVQFLPPRAAAEVAATTAEEGARSGGDGTLGDKAASLLGGFTSSASATLGSWWSSASAAVSEGKDKMLPSVKEVISKAANKAETLAHQIMERKESASSASPDDAADKSAAAAAAENTQTDEDRQADDDSNSNAIKAPWDDIPPSYRQSTTTAGEADALTPQRWRRLLLHVMAEDDSVFLWAPESAFGAHRAQPQPEPEPHHHHHHHDGSSPSRLSHLRPSYPDFTFEPDEELLLSRIGLSANLLLHCNDSYNFDSDVEPHFVDPARKETAELRQMRLRVVPRAVTEERFWAAYLWRVACLALCTTVEQESVVKTLLRKPAVAVIKAPMVAAGGGPVGDEYERGGGGGASSRSGSDDGADHHHHHHREASGESASELDDHQKLSALPDVDALAADAEEAQSLLDEVVEEMLSGGGDDVRGNDDDDDDDSSPTSAAALFVASLNGVERCLRNTDEGIAALDRVLQDDRVDAGWKQARGQQREQLLAMKEALAAALERGNDAKNKSKNKKKDEPAAAPAPKPMDVADVASPAPKEPAENDDDDQKKSPSGSAASNKSSPAGSAGSTSKSRTPVLMPWEEEDD